MTTSSRQSMAPGTPLSPYQAAFYDFVERHPECLELASHQALARPSLPRRPSVFLSHYVPIQPWPLFLDSAITAAIAEHTLRAFDLVRSLPERLFDNQPRRLCEFYGLDPDVEDDLQRLLDLPWRRGGEPMRADFMVSGQVPKCIEINATANVGGIFNLQVVESCLAVPILSRFLREQRVTVRYRDPWRTLLHLAIERALARDLHRDGTLNVAFIIPGPRDFDTALPYIAPQYQSLLTAMASDVHGELFFCDYEDLERRGDVLTVGGKAAHILLQDYGDVPLSPRGVEVDAWLDGIIDLYAGPMNWIYSDKRNLALLSEQAESDAFSRDEAAWIAAHIPWSRLLRPGWTTYHGERVELEKLLFQERRNLVLKPAQSFGGTGVVIGRFVADAEWREHVSAALAEPDTFTVQEYLPSDLHRFQWGEKGSELCELNWGIFAAGDRFGGIYLRLGPPAEDGLVNVSHGAIDGCAVELIPEGGDVEPSLIDRVWSFGSEG